MNSRSHPLLWVIVAAVAALACVVYFRDPARSLRQRIDTLEQRVEDRLEQRRESLESTLAGAQATLEERIGARLKSLEQRLEQRVQEIEGRFADPRDDAALAGLTPEDLPQLTTDLFREMDGGIPLEPHEIQGRNAWNLWTAGSQMMLDQMARTSYGLIDILKVLDSRRRNTRFRDAGLMNEPGFQQAKAPDEFGLWIDQPQAGVDGVDQKIAAEGVDPRVYGRSTGILGLRLFPNPAFDAAARQAWDADKFYNDTTYFTNPDLVRPYVVGMTCGICHIAPHPLHPPADPEAPEWSNLASAIGNQYFREGKVFASGLEPGSFLWEMINAQPAGTSDTSRIATDHINNPNAINAIFLLAERQREAEANPTEVMGRAARLLPGDAAEERHVPHILKDGADSIGVPGATIRVYVNIGLFSQQWLKRHNPLVGVFAQRPFEIETAQRNSVYWRATEQRLANIAAFFTRIKPMHLADAPGGGDRIDTAQLDRGKRVFAEHCAECHSSKRPAAGESWTDVVERDDFLVDNLLSDELRHPVTEIGTNSARALATNAQRGHIWDNFSSETYKALPSVGEIEAYNLLDPQQPLTFRAAAGGVGYYRTPSLISLWSSAPFLHNNTLGEFTGDPSVDGRLRAFDDAAQKLLWPEKRLNEASIWRTTRESFLQIPAAVLPDEVRRLLADHIENGYFNLGPIPEGTPMNLLLNLNLSLGRLEHLRDLKTVSQRAHELVELAVAIKLALFRTKGLTPDEARDLLKRDLVPVLIEHSNCPDFVEDRGHDFGTSLPDDEKLALIEFLKTF
jgi:cytochrome c5